MLDQYAFPYWRLDDIDVDKNNIVSIDEFKKWHSSFMDRIVFKYYDSNGDGYIDKKVMFGLYWYLQI